ncbi:MAG: efflux transporter outer membrane subunit [Rhodospirillales bacterium]|nr:MAG: efflux transporter outer membrane subunit [Rhodospirillales bacterium]
MRRARFLASAASAVLVGGCSLLGPAYKAGKVDTPERWQWGAAGAGEWPDPAWWRGFGSAELDRLQGEAVAGNRDLRAAVARVAQAEAQAKIAGAALLPTLGADASVSRVSQSTSRGRAATTTYGVGLTAGYQIDLFGANAAAAGAARTRVEASRYDRETVALTVNAGVAATYFQLLALRDRTRFATASLAAATRLLQLLEEQRRIGTTSDLEVAQQRASVASQRASIPALVQAERETLAALALLLGRAPQGFTADGRDLSTLRPPPVVSGIPSELLQRRPDIRRAEADLRAANFDIAQARAARFPRIQLTADAGSSSAALSNLFNPSGFLYALAAGLVAPIFEGGRLKGQEKLSQARYEELVQSYHNAILSAFRDVDNALSGVEQFRQQLVFEREARAHARDAYRLAELRYRAGSVDFLTVLVTQRAVLQSEDAVVLAELAQAGALVDLYKALGGGWSGALAQ